MSLSKCALVMGVLLASTGCYIDFKRPGGPKVVAGSAPMRGYRPAGNKSLVDGLGGKVVEDKKPPTRLIARDGTSCTVSKKKYDSTVLGASVWCTWFRTDG